MLKKIKILVCCLITILFFTTCKKYPDGPVFSLRTVLNRLAGTYELDKFIVNDIDSTNLVPPCNQRTTLEHTTSDGRYYFKFDRHANIYGLDANGAYFLSSDKKNIAISYNNGNNYNPPFTQGRNILYPVKQSNGEWQIRRLTNKEFWIKAEFSGLTFEVHLKKIHSL